MYVTVDQTRGKISALGIKGLFRRGKVAAAKACNEAPGDQNVRRKQILVEHIHHAAIFQAQVRRDPSGRHINQMV